MRASELSQEINARNNEHAEMASLVEDRLRQQILSEYPWDVRAAAKRLDRINPDMMVEQFIAARGRRLIYTLRFGAGIRSDKYGNKGYANWDKRRDIVKRQLCEPVEYMGATRWVTAKFKWSSKEVLADIRGQTKAFDAAVEKLKKQDLMLDISIAPSREYMDYFPDIRLDLHRAGEFSWFGLRQGFAPHRDLKKVLLPSANGHALA